MANDMPPTFDFDDLDELLQAAREAGALLPDLQEQALMAKHLIQRLEAVQAGPDWRPDLVASMSAATQAIIGQIEEQTSLLTQLPPMTTPTLH